MVEMVVSAEAHCTCLYQILSGVLAGKGTDPSGVGFVITDAPIPFVPAEVGTAISGSGVTS